MRVLIVSDTHGYHDNLNQVLDEIGKIDMFIHLGDIERSEHYIEGMVNCPTHMVAGNNDFFTRLPKEKEFQIGDHKVFITHGHNYYVSGGTSHLKREALKRHTDIVMYGHTHRPKIEQEEGVYIVNPGSLSFPRQEGRKPSYLVLNVDDAGNLEFQPFFL